jgi:hypothetical protein
VNELGYSTAYDEPTMKCPYCGAECECDWVDVGVGSVQCGPYHCENCGSTEIGPEMKIKYDSNSCKTIILNSDDFTDREMKTGWYEPVSRKISPYANTVNGQLVNHKVAETAYHVGLLDEKQIEE